MYGGRLDLHSPLWAGDLEYRQEGDTREIVGKFLYQRLAVVNDRGRIRKEYFASGAFKWALTQPDRRIHMLSGHDYNKPLAVRNGRDGADSTLDLADDDEALSFRARLPAERDQPSWMRDVVRALGAGLIGGISPGFSIPPASAVPDAEKLVPEVGNPSVLVRVISAAVLHELSLVTLPAYRETEVEMRADGIGGRGKKLWLWL